MCDSLDLDALVQQGLAYRRKMRLRQWIFFGLLLAFVIFLVLMQCDMPVEPGHLYLWENGQWRIEPALDADAPGDVQAAADGTVWVSGLVHDYLYHFDGTDWRKYDPSDQGLRGSDLDAFTLGYGEVWGVVGPDVFRTHQPRWYIDQAVLTGDEAVAIAVGEFNFLVVDAGGRIWRRVDGEWSSLTPRQALPGYLPGHFRRPSLAQTSDDTVWLAYDGLWVFDGEAWNRVVNRTGPEDADTRLIGADLRTIWLGTAAGLDVYDIAANKWQSIPLAVMGLPDDASLYTAVHRSGVLWVGADRGIVTFDGETWQPVDIPGLNPALHIRHLAFDGAGRLWAAAVDPVAIAFTPSISPPVQTFLVTLFLFVLLVYTLFGLLMPWSRMLQQRLALARERLPVVFPEFQTLADPTVGKRGMGQGLLLLLAAVVVTIVAFNSRSIIGLLPLYYLLAYLWITWPAFRRLLFDRELDAANRAHLRRLLWQRTLLYLVLGVLAWIVFSRLSPDRDDNLTSVLRLVAAFYISGVVVFVAYMFLATLPLLWISWRPFGRGDYPAALRQITRLRGWFPRETGAMMLHGAVLMFADRHAESEQLWRQALVESQNASPYILSAFLINLAATLSGQGRNDEGLPLRELALELSPHKGETYRALAGHYLLTDGEPEQALALSEHMLRCQQRPRLPYFEALRNWASTLAIRAAALARNGHFDEASAVIDRAFREGDRYYRLGQANLHIYAAHIRLAQDDRAGAEDHLRQASALDPLGWSGRRAREALADLPAD